MIKKLQRKFIFIATLSVFFVMLVIIGGINLANLYSTNKQIDMLLTLLSENEGKFPLTRPIKRTNSKTAKASTATKQYCGLRAQRGKPVYDALFSGASQILPTRYSSLTQVIYSAHLVGRTKACPESTGERAQNRLYRCIQISCHRKAIRKADNFPLPRERLAAVGRVLGASLAIGISGLAVIFVLISVFSRRAVKTRCRKHLKNSADLSPTQATSFKKPACHHRGKRRVLGYTGGKNEWTASIQNQTKRMSVQPTTFDTFEA